MINLGKINTQDRIHMSNYNKNNNFTSGINNQCDTTNQTSFKGTSGICKFRFQRGSLADSLKTVVDIKSKEDLYALLKEAYGGIFSIDNIAIKPHGYDNRIGWNTHIVTINNNAIGYTDGMLLK